MTKLPIVLVLLMPILIGCSTTQHVSAPELVPITHPETPRPVALENETFSLSENGRYCMTPESVRIMLRNKAELLRWVEEAQNILNYYQSM